jgi:hypothetical protein
VAAAVAVNRSGETAAAAGRRNPRRREREKRFSVSFAG